MEDLQGVLHDLQDISARAGQPFQGIVINDLEQAWRDQGVFNWTIRIEPSRPAPQSQVEVVSPDDIPAEEEEVDSNP